MLVAMYHWNHFRIIYFIALRSVNKEFCFSYRNDPLFAKDGEFSVNKEFCFSYRNDPLFAGLQKTGNFQLIQSQLKSPYKNPWKVLEI